MNFNMKLKKIRTFRKMTQKELSEKIGLTDQHRIVQYEKGVRVPKKDLVDKMAKALKLTANDITAEVTRAKKAEDTLKGSIQVNADAIKLRVSKGKISSEISAESGSISIKSNRISISSTNFTLTASGYVTMKGASCQGSFEAKNGEWWIKMSYGEITGGYSGSTYGYIDFNGAYNNTNEHTLRIMGNTCVDIKGKLCTATSWNAGTVYTTYTGTRRKITNIRDIGNGAIEWSWIDETYRNGLLMG